MITCFYCDTDKGPFVREHFVPRHKVAELVRRAQGNDAAMRLVKRLQQNNIVSACGPCDRNKGALLPTSPLITRSDNARAHAESRLARLQAIEAVLNGSDSGRDPTPSQKETQFHLSSIERWLGHKLPPPTVVPSWVSNNIGPQTGEVRSLRAQARHYIDLKSKEG